MQRASFEELLCTIPNMNMAARLRPDLVVTLINLDHPRSEEVLRILAGRLFSFKPRRSDMNRLRVLLAEDDDIARGILQRSLEQDGFEVVTAISVGEALSQIAAEPFDVLLSDLHMPNAGCGLTVISAMCNTQPQAVTLVISRNQALGTAVSAMLLQPDEAPVKAIEIGSLRKIIHHKLGHKAQSELTTKSVATILEQDVDATIRRWSAFVEHAEELACVRLTFRERTGYLPQLFRDLIYRLRLPIQTTAAYSTAARQHGQVRHCQGYTPAMVVEESRILEMSIFKTLQHNLRSLDPSQVLQDVIVIADECDSQLRQAMLCYTVPAPSLSAAQLFR
jgi:ActR/RegA family two-component response regulator